MEYKRLTGRDNWGGCVTIKNGTAKDEILERLAELEDKIENGTLVELPCKLGTTVYCLCKGDYVLVTIFVLLYRVQMGWNRAWIDK